MSLGVRKASVQEYCRETHGPSVHLEVGTKERLGLALENGNHPQRYTDFVNEAVFRILSAKGGFFPASHLGARLCNFLAVYFIFPLTGLTALGNTGWS